MGHKEQLIHALDIGNRVIESSSFFDKDAKLRFKESTKFYREFFVNNPNINSYQLKSLTNDFLTYWHESIHPDTEIFWAELKKNSIDFERKDPLLFALDKNRFRNVHQAMEARKHWSEIRKLEIVLERFSKENIEHIDRIVVEDENKRLAILNKCLKNQKIPRSQYLKFGESIAYFSNCQLFGKYFSPLEVEKLYAIWKNL